MPYRVLSIILIRFICQISLYVNVNCVFVRCEICYAILFYWMNCHNPKSMICETVIKHLLASAQTAWIIIFFYVLLQICWGGISISDYKSIRKDIVCDCSSWLLAVSQVYGLLCILYKCCNTISTFLNAFQYRRLLFTIDWLIYALNNHSFDRLRCTARRFEFNFNFCVRPSFHSFMYDLNMNIFQTRINDELLHVHDDLFYFWI